VVRAFHRECRARLPFAALVGVACSWLNTAPPLWWSGGPGYPFEDLQQLVGAHGLGGLVELFVQDQALRGEAIVEDGRLSHLFPTWTPPPTLAWVLARREVLALAQAHARLARCLEGHTYFELGRRGPTAAVCPLHVPVARRQYMREYRNKRR
jgi:hypothetical protein